MSSEKPLENTDQPQAQIIIDERSTAVLSEFAKAEARTTAQAVLREAVAAASKPLAQKLEKELKPEIESIIEHHLLKAINCPQVTQTTREKAELALRQVTVEAVFNWSKEKALLAAQEATEIFLRNCFLQSGKDRLTEYFDKKLVSYSGSKTDAAALGKFLQDPAQEAKICQELLTPKLRRDAQKVAEDAAAKIAITAGDEVAKQLALSAAQKIATETVQMEITRFVTSEARNRATKNVREFVEKQIGESHSDKQEQTWFSKIDQIAGETVDEVLKEVINPLAFTLNKEPVRQLVCQAARTTANDVIENITLSPIKKKRMPASVFIGIQIATICLLIWFLLCGGDAQMSAAFKPYLKTILPPSFYGLMCPTEHPAQDEMAPVEEEPLKNDASAPERPN